MVREKKPLHPFDKFLGSAIRATRVRRGVTREVLAERAGIALSNLKRREDGVNETTVPELERIAAVLDVPTREIIDMALADFSGNGNAEDGLRKLVEPVSEGSRTVTDADNVTYLGHMTPGLQDAANTDDRATKND